ncbi:MAG: nucleotide exchange factor GrpE [Alphaproteobacteria bacterium]|nr:nucleotide exchange factor GrpE [Alphaproteobacteria bacterium]
MAKKRPEEQPTAAEEAAETAEAEAKAAQEAEADAAAQVTTEPGPKPVEPETAAGTEAGEDENPVARLETEVGELKDQLLRAMAETENTRRRLTKDRDDAFKYGASNLARDLLNVADNLRRALEAIPEDALAEDEALKALADGVKLTEDELLKAFERHGIQKIDPYGEKFDHNHHQAMMQLENTGKPAGTVAQVLAPGYVLHDRLLRPAMVGVAKGEPNDDKAEDESRVDTTA